MAGASTYTFGNCTWYVASTLDWVRGGWGNAADWPGNAARQGFQLTPVPTIGAAACYNAGPHYSVYGHVGIVMAVYSPTSFLISEMNFVGFDMVDQRVSATTDIEAFILPPGVQPGSGAPATTGSGSGTADDVRLEWEQLRGWLNGGVEDAIARWRRLHDLVAGLAP